MKILNILLSAFRALRRNKMRSFLTMLGIIIGVAAVIAMLAIGQGAEFSVEQQITSLGTNVLIVLPGSQSTSGLRQGAGTMTNLTEDDALAIQRECPAVALLSPGTRSGGQVIAGNMNWATGIEGTGPDYLEIRKWGIEYGEFYTDQDVKGAAKVCVLGKTVADALFPESSPVGQNVRIRNVPFKVIGVLSKKGQNAMGQDQDDVILAPYTTVTRRLTWYPYLRQILVSASSPANIPVAQKEITELLRMRHKIMGYDSDDFTIRNQADLANAATATSEILTILLASIASVSLLVGGIGIMNIMLVSVTERTREIGIRMSVGARGAGHSNTVPDRGAGPQPARRDHRDHPRRRGFVRDLNICKVADDHHRLFDHSFLRLLHCYRNLLWVLPRAEGSAFEPDRRPAVRVT